jgi:hypothetical protein
MGQIQRHDFSEGWNPSADAFNAPKNSLLRADNLMLDERGALALRQGSQKVNSSALATLDCHSLFTTTVSGSRYRMTGATDAIYANSTSIASGVAGSGDISFGAHMGQILFARSTTKKKYDGTTVRNWGIAAPVAAPTLAVTAPDSLTLASCDSTELPVMTSNEGTQSFAADRFSVASGAVQILPDTTTGRGVSTKTFTAPTNFNSFTDGAVGSNDDILDFFGFITEIQFVTAIGLMIDVNDGTFQNDWYEYRWNPAEVTELTPSAADSLASNYDIEGHDRDSVLSRIENRGRDIDSLSVGISLAPSSWNHFSVPRGKMERHGLTPGKNWTTVRAVRVVALGIAGGSQAGVRFDDIKITRSVLTGRFASRVVAVFENGTYQALSGPSPISNEIECNAQGLQVTVDAATIAALDSQVTALWVYLMGGRLNAFYRFAVGDLEDDPGAFDYTSPFEASHFTSVEGIADFTTAFEVGYGGTIGPKSHNYAWEEDYLTLSEPVSIAITTSEITALAANLRLETDNTVPPDNIIAIEGPHFDRTLCLTESFIYPSRNLNPDSYSAGQVVRAGDATETALWLKKLGDSALFLGTTRDIYRLDGDWTVLPDGSINVTKRPMHVSEPPISHAVDVGTVNGVESLIYLSGDGWHILGHGPLVGNEVDLLWRGFTRHGVEYVNIADTSARFRVAVSKNQLFAITPEGSDTTSSATLHVYHFGKRRWYRHTYPQAFRSIYAEYDGTLIAGDAAGFVRTLDLATKQDDGEDIDVVLWTPADDDGKPFISRHPENLWIRMATGGNTATIAFHLNGNDTADSTTTTAQTTTDTGNLNVNDTSDHTQFQMRITGSFNSFTFRGWGMRYLEFPLPQVIHDTGYVDLSDDVLKWIAKIRVKARSASAFVVTPYWDGVAGTVTTITPGIQGGTATVFDAPMGREDRAKTARVVITSSSPSQVFWLEFWFNGTGKPLQKRVSFNPEAA